ncbi:Cas10/Cmr2 second palm domain-containing protein [Desulfobacca acetoxidans]
MSFLVLFDTDRIQEYVFATQKLKAIRGGSFLLEDLNCQTKDLIKKYKGQVIYVGGGAGAATFDADRRARNYCQELEQLYRDETVIAGITTWIEPEKAGESFLNWVERAERGLRRRKDEKARIIPLVSNPYEKVCELCGRLPATICQKDEGYICRSCQIQMENGAKYKYSLMYQAIEDSLSPGSVKWPESLANIGKKSDPEGYIGLIYSDGNRMGLRRQELLEGEPQKARENYARFSECVDQATRWAMVQAVIDVLGQPQDNRTYPVQFFITGGDDMLAAVPAHQAVPIASKFGELFREYYKNGRKDESGKILFTGLENTASVAIGVALAKQNYPLYSLIDTARELQKLAKQRAWKEREGDVSTLDFLATSSSLLQPVKEQRQKELAYDNLSLTQRPYTIEEAKILLERIRTLKKSGFPRNKINDLWQPLYKGRLAASLDYLVLLSRLSDQGSPSPRQALLQVAEAFGLSPFPWRLNNHFTYHTPLLDLAELYDFILEEEN